MLLHSHIRKTVKNDTVNVFYILGFSEILTRVDKALLYLTVHRIHNDTIIGELPPTFSVPLSKCSVLSLKGERHPFYTSSDVT